MYGFHSRAVRGTFGAFLLALGACADQPAAPAPIQRLEPHFSLGEVITVTNLSGGIVDGSLPWAVRQVGEGDVIRFAPSLAGQTITLDTTLIVKGRPFTLEGPADRGITISGGGRVRVFDLDPGAAGNETVLRNLTIAHGFVGSNGSGAGIRVGGTTNAWLRVENSTFTANVAATSPAISGVSTVLVNTTVSGNTARLNGSAYAAVGSTDLRLVNSTIAHNTSAGVNSGNLVLRNSIVSHHSGPNCDIISVTHEGRSISNDGSCGGETNVIITDPQLGPLADNGGPSLTHALLAGSPAINAGSSCSVSVDQRYAPRDAQCDLGAYEFTDFTTVALTVASNATVDGNGRAVLTGTVRCSRDETFDVHVELRQPQKSGKTTTDVRANATTPISCTTSVQSWSVTLVPADRPFQSGSAAATAETRNTENWVTPASVSQAVKLFKSRK